MLISQRQIPGSESALELKANGLILQHRQILAEASNIDSCSEHLNAEMGYYAASEVVGQQVDAVTEEGTVITPSGFRCPGSSPHATTLLPPCRHCYLLR